MAASFNSFTPPCSSPISQVNEKINFQSDEKKDEKKELTESDEIALTANELGVEILHTSKDDQLHTMSKAESQSSSSTSTASSSPKTEVLHVSRGNLPPQDTKIDQPKKGFFTSLVSSFKSSKTKKKEKALSEFKSNMNSLITEFREVSINNIKDLPDNFLTIKELYKESKVINITNNQNKTCALLLNEFSKCNSRKEIEMKFKETLNIIDTCINSDPKDYNTAITFITAMTSLFLVNKQQKPNIRLKEDLVNKILNTETELIAKNFNDFVDGKNIIPSPSALYALINSSRPEFQALTNKIDRSKERSLLTEKFVLLKNTMSGTDNNKSELTVGNTESTTKITNDLRRKINSFTD